MRPTVLVGVGGRDGRQALAWAVDEAAATGGDVEIVHACRPDSPLAGPSGRVSVDELELSDLPLARAVSTARARLGGDRVHVFVRAGEPAPAVLAAADAADLVVVGAPTSHASAVHRIVARAPCPTVVVRPLLAGRNAPFAGHVVVGLSDAAGPEATCGFAFRYAAVHRLPLTAVHVTREEREDYWYDERTLSSHFPVEPAALRILARRVEPWMLSFRTVAVKRAVYGGRPMEGLLRAAAGARLLVVGDRARVTAPFLSISLGRAAVDQAGCPVAVVRGHRAASWRRSVQPEPTAEVIAHG
jgi:nucleotide-binding universal stress UspA family protein